MINFRNPYIWDDLNDLVKQELSSPVPVRVFQSTSHALIEIGMAFQVLYSHKRQYVNGLCSLGNHADEMSVYLSRQGVKNLSGVEASSLEIDEKKTLFSVYDVDDAITGQKYVETSFFEQDSKIFRVFVFHASHLLQWPSMNVGETDIYILHHPSTGGAVALFGRRAQNINSLFCSTLQWSGFQKMGTFPSLLENKKWVEHLESHIPENGLKLFQTPVQRVYDRALIYWKEIDARAVYDLLIHDYQIDSNFVECLSLSRWVDTKLITQFSQRGWDAQVFRGTLILSSSLSGQGSFVDQLEKVLKKVTQISKMDR